PRSEEVIKSYAAIRGGEAGLKYAEAFQVALNILEF
ncbi:MAG: PIG-L family deacetylase, partial [Proteobacteria bacterium]|nr:PIG-L family deacetylase [Pseudomonadota bacterium]